MSRPKTLFLLLAVFFLLGITSCQTPTIKPPPDKVTVQLKWVHQAQFAGFYVAQSEGLYAEENLEVTFLEAGPEIDGLNHVLTGEADFAITAPEQIFLRRSAGAPVVAIATTYRRNPFVLVTMASSGIQHPIDFAGKTAALGGIDGLVQVEAMMKNLNLKINEMDIVPYDFDMTPFYAGEIDIVPAFAAGSLVQMQETGHEFNLIWPSEYGVHVYSDTIVTTEEIIAADPDLVTRFLRATLNGHRLAIEDTALAVVSSLNYIPDADPVVQEKMVDASLPLVHTGQDQIGWMRESVWVDTHDILLQQGILPAPVDVNAVYTMQFLEAVYQD